MAEKRRESEYKRKDITDYMSREEINALVEAGRKKILAERPEALEIAETVSAVVESGKNKIGSWADAIY